MATPRTPRKRAAKADASVDDAGTLGNVEDIATDPLAETPMIDDAEVVLDEPETKVPETADPDTTARDGTTEPTAPDADAEANADEATPEPSPSEHQAAHQTSHRLDAPAIASAPTVVKSGPGFVPLVLGGVVAAALGFGLARYVVPEGWPVPGATRCFWNSPSPTPVSASPPTGWACCSSPSPN